MFAVSLDLTWVLGYAGAVGMSRRPTPSRGFPSRQQQQQQSRVQKDLERVRDDIGFGSLSFSDCGSVSYGDGMLTMNGWLLVAWQWWSAYVSGHAVVCYCYR